MMKTKFLEYALPMAAILGLTITDATAQDCNANFSYTQTTDGLTVSFEPMEPDGAIAFEWSFGDASGTSGEFDPMHTFAEEGTYTVCLTVYTASDSCTVCTDLCINGASTLSLREVGFADDDIILYPNPGATSWNLEVNLNHAQLLAIQLADATGKVFVERTLKGKQGRNSMVIPGAELAAGMYFITISGDNGSVVKKAMKQ